MAFVPSYFGRSVPQVMPAAAVPATPGGFIQVTAVPDKVPLRGSLPDGKAEAAESLPSSSAPHPATSLVPAASTGPRQARTPGKLFRRDGKVFNSIGAPPFWKVPTNNEVHHIIDSYVVSPALTSSASIATFGAFSFAVSSLAQITSLQTVFDQYRVDQVEVWLIPRMTNANDTVANLFGTVIDYDDATPLSSFSAAMDYQNVVVSNGHDGHYRSFRPHAALAAYSGAFTSYANVEEMWIDAGSPAVQHYGLKTVWTTTDAAQVMDMIVRLHTSWRNVR